MIAWQFDTTTDFSSLLRANTPTSRMMTTYTRRGPGQAYLKQTLGVRVNQLIQEPELDLEINPLKIYDKLCADMQHLTGKCDMPKSSSPEQAHAHPKVQEIITPRVVTLMEITDTFLTTIISSLNSVPYGIRWICKQIKYLAKKKYPDATDASICSLIGGFFFLRFLNPAIVTPQAYMLIDMQPSALLKRSLTMVKSQFHKF